MYTKYRNPSVRICQQAITLAEYIKQPTRYALRASGALPLGRYTSLMNDIALPFVDPLAHQRTLAAPIAERLRERIIEGELKPGARLNERLLCEQLRVSRTPLREALRRLAHDGLVTLVPNRGAFVSEMSKQWVRESFEIMGALEALAAELACDAIRDDEIAEIEALTFEMLACHARRDLPEYYRLNRAIHHCIAAAARNSLLTLKTRSGMHLVSESQSSNPNRLCQARTAARLTSLSSEHRLSDE